MINKEKQINKEKILQNNDNIKNKNNDIEDKKDSLNNIILIQNKKINSLKSQLLSNQKQINDIELRKLAKIENIKKTTKEKIKNIKNIEIERFLTQTIPIIDSLEDILKSSNILNIKDTPLIKGLELTLKSLFNILYKLGVKIVGQKNEIFNSKIHTPIVIESSEKIPDNHIISVKQKGFSFNKVLLRKAIVTIRKI